jgi:hypothetical protein
VSSLGFPTPAIELVRPAERAIWFDGYVRTYLERELQDLATISSLPDFRRLIAAWRFGALDLVLSDFILAELRRILPRLVHRHGQTLPVIDNLIDSLAPGSRSPSADWGAGGEAGARAVAATAAPPSAPQIEGAARL